MPTPVLRERPTSRPATSHPPGVTLLYSLTGVGDDAYARWYVTAATPLMHGGLYRQKISIDPEGGGLWDVVVPYGPRPEPELNEFRLSFDTTGGTAHVTHSKDHIQTHIAVDPWTENNPHKGGINVADGVVEGVDIVISQFAWTEDWQLPITYMSMTYGTLIEAVTGTVNLNPFRNRPAGTVRFDGGVGSASNKEPDLCSISFRFTTSKHTSDAMPNFKGGIAKMGWEYLWVESERKKDGTNLPTVPRAVHVERVYDADDFAKLGIGS